MSAPMRVYSEFPRMTREEFRRWAAIQPKGRYERIDGYVVGMSPERLGHTFIKTRVFQALEAALKHAGSECRAIPDGATVHIDDATDYEPDVMVSCGQSLDFNDAAAPPPMIVVEVASPSTRAADSSGKFTDYFRMPSVCHYLIVHTHRREAIHHRRAGDHIETRIVVEGGIVFDPPGITVALDDFYSDFPR